ncbi:MAG TPA: hypothetical protein VM425_13160 [Myxococcota bacterium]|nr:hypothetical protein [Myxococcota bacterium]
MIRNSDSPKGKITSLLRRSRRRLIAGRAASALLECAVFALLSALAFGGLAGPLDLGAGAWSIFLVGLGTVIMAYVAREAVRGTSHLDVAVLLDERLGFKDRISSCLSFENRSRQTAFMRAHLAETAQSLRQVAAKPLSFPVPRRLRALLLFCALGLVSLIPHAERSSLRGQEGVSASAHKAGAARGLAQDLKRVRREAGLRGLPRLSGMIADVEREMSVRIDLLTAQERKLKAKAHKESETDSSGQTQAETKAAMAALRGRELGTGTGSRLAGSATYRPTGKFDSFPAAAYAATFAELDARLLDGDLTARQLSDLARHLEGVADRFSSQGFESDHQAELVERATLSHDGDEVLETSAGNSFDRSLKPLQQKSFSEFLMRYAAHIGQKALGHLRFEPGGRNDNDVSIGNIPAPPGKQATSAMRRAGTRPAEDMPILEGQAGEAGTSSQAVATSAGKKGGRAGAGTSPGGAGAGSGGGGRKAGAPPVLPRALGGEYLPLRGKLSDGKAVVQVISERGKSRLASRRSAVPEVTYSDVFVQYATGAEAELSGERVPLQMRGYIRDYFRSIRPGQE